MRESKRDGVTPPMTAEELSGGFCEDADAAKALKLSKFQGFCCELQPFRTPKLRIAIIWSMCAHRICIASIHFPLF